MTARFRLVSPRARFITLPVAGLSVLPVPGVPEKWPYCYVVDVGRGWKFHVFGGERAVSARIHALKVLDRLGREFVD